MIFEVAHHMALLPLLWLLALRLKGSLRGQEWWWIAAAFSVSWVADTAAHWVNPFFVSNLYPVGQSAIVSAVLLYRRDARTLLVVITMTAVAATLWRGPLGVDVFLRTVAWGAIALIAWNYPAIGRLRVVLLVYFGLGLVSWWGYAAWPGWTSWILYQGVRATGLGLFCWASLHPVALRVERG